MQRDIYILLYLSCKSSIFITDIKLNSPLICQQKCVIILSIIGSEPEYFILGTKQAFKCTSPHSMLDMPACLH